MRKQTAFRDFWVISYPVIRTRIKIIYRKVLESYHFFAGKFLKPVNLLRNFWPQKTQESFSLCKKMQNERILIACLHIVHLTMRQHLFTKFWLVDTWFFTHWRHHRAVIRLENVRQSNIRRGKKLSFQLSHKHPLWVLRFSTTPQRKF